MGSKSSSIIRMVTESELEALHVETAINTTSKITKVSNESVTRALIRGNVRTAKKAVKDITLAMSHLFVDDATGSALDDAADDRGIAPRFTASQSSTYVRIIADPGTVYQSGVHTVSDNKGNVFDLSGDITIGSKGYGYVKVRSQQAGSSTNVDPYTLINMSPIPSGHIGVLNEYQSEYGRDAEDDDVFRQRIKRGPDELAQSTLVKLAQTFMKINSNVFRVIYEGTNIQGKVVLGILTVNGIDLTSDELQTILEQSSSSLALTEMAPIGTTSFGVLLKNAEYYPIDIDIRLQLFAGSNIDSTVKTIQQKFSKYVDFRFWNSATDKVEWDDLLGIVKNVSGVKYVPDDYFIPNNDITVPRNKFPRFRGFIARDLDGNVLVNQAGTLDPIFYPNEEIVDFTETVL
jgi:hypothetical protein